MNPKPTLIVLSDIHGIPDPKPAWKGMIENFLTENFHLTFLSSLHLAGIPEGTPKEMAHHRLVNGGINLAVKTLEMHITEPVYTLGLSIGGTILWKYALKQAEHIRFLASVSATRLRHESQKPSCPFQLFYGEDEQNGPSEDWFIHMNVDKYSLAGGHDFYNEEEMERCLEKIKAETLKY